MEEVVPIEIHCQGQWWRAGELTVLNVEQGAGSPCRFAYADDYLTAHIDGLTRADRRAVGARFPLEFEVWRTEGWPAWCLDIAPAGAARRWWRARWGASDLNEQQLDMALLRERTVAPIGNLRVPPADDVGPAVGFDKREVCERASGFLEYAAEMGAALGGATGAGGDAPKVLLAEDETGQVFPDAVLADEDVRKCWLVKWPRGRDTDRDRLVLESEYLFARVLHEMGLPTCPGEWRVSSLEKPSFWLPRFDRVVADGSVERLAVESFYSLSGISVPGASSTHQRFLADLLSLLTLQGEEERFQALATEYVCRDLLDVVLGNSDNHGRNRAVIRGAQVQLAPIYDLAPMVMDPEGITRSTRWDVHEHGGRIDWRGVCHSIDSIDGEALEADIRDFAERLLALPDLLADAGLSDEVFDFPRIYLRTLPKTLADWGLR